MLFVLVRYVCSGASSSPTPTDGLTGYLCPPGFYCPEGSGIEKGCPINSYQNQLGEPNCTVCPAGYMCPYENMTSPLPCQEGNATISIIVWSHTTSQMIVNIKKFYMKSPLDW